MNSILKDTLDAQLSSSVFFNEEANLFVPGTLVDDEYVIEGFFDTVDYSNYDVNNISRLVTANRFVTSEDLKYVKGMTLNGISVKQIQRDLNGLTVLWLN